MDTKATEVLKLIDNLAGYAWSLSLRCDWIKTDLEALKARPNWPTQADDALRDLELKLQITLSAVIQARQSLTEKRALYNV